MPQPSAPHPLAPRPDPQGPLLEAVRQRQSQRCQQLLQQWVHRRGLHALERFCSGDLRHAQGEEAVQWLRALLADEPSLPGDVPPAGAANRETAGVPSAGAERAITPSGSPGAPPSPGSALQGAALVESEPEPRHSETASPATIAAATAAHPIVTDVQVSQAPPTCEPGAEDLQRQAPLGESATRSGASEPASDQESWKVRAEAAVNDAFAALARSFPEAVAGSPISPVEEAPHPMSPSTEEPAALTAPIPATVAGEQSLVPEVVAAPPPPSPLFATAPGAGPLGGLPRPLQPVVAASIPMSSLSGEAVDPAPLSLATGSLPAEGPSAAPNPQAPAALALADVPAPHEGSGMPSVESADGGSAPPVLAAAQRRLGRLARQGQSGLSRLRGLMRDCVEETVSLLRHPGDEPTDAALRSDAEPEPVPAWSELPLRGEIASGADQEAPEATIAVVDAAVLNAAEVPVTPAWRRLAGLGRREQGGGERPAPAPSTLSDLRAWLPDSSEGRRAS